jgi:hypothetical protein
MIEPSVISNFYFVKTALLNGRKLTPAARDDWEKA